MAEDESKLKDSGQTESQQPRTTEDDEIYSPKSEELLNMPSYLARSLLYIVLAGIAVGLGWAYWGKKDVVIKAMGQLIRKGDAQVVQVGINGVVRSVLVKEGETVKKGQVLAQLDTSKEKINTQKQKKGYDALVKKKACEEKALDLLLNTEASFNSTKAIQPQVLENLSSLCQENHAQPIITFKTAISAFKKAKIQSQQFFPKEQMVQKQSLEAKNKDLEIKNIKLEEAQKDIQRVQEELKINISKLDSQTTLKTKINEAQQKINETRVQLQSLKNELEKGQKNISIKKKERENSDKDFERIKEELNIYTRRYDDKTTAKLKFFEAQRKLDEAQAGIQNTKNEIDTAKRSIVAKKEALENAQNDLTRLSEELNMAKDNFATGKTDTLKLLETQKKYQEAKLRITELEGNLKDNNADLLNKQETWKRAKLDLKRYEEEAKMYTQMMEEGLTDRIKFMEVQRKYDSGKNTAQNAKSEIDKLNHKNIQTQKKLEGAKKDIVRIEKELKYRKKAKDEKTSDKIKLMEAQRKYDEGLAKTKSLQNEIESLESRVQEKENKITQSQNNIKRLEFEVGVARNDLENATPDKMKLIEVQRKYDSGQAKLDSLANEIDNIKLKNRELEFKIKEAEKKLENNNFELEIASLNKEDKVKVLETQRKYDEAVSKKNNLMSEISQAESDIISQEMKLAVGKQKNDVTWHEAQDNYSQAIITFKQAIVAAKNRIKEIANGLNQMEADIKLFKIHKDFAVLKSPTDGVVSYVKPKGPGEVVRSGETLFSVILSSQPLMAKVRIPNRSRGKVKTGLPVKIKMDSFPFQKYGVVKGKLEMISPGAKQDKRGSFYEGSISLEKDFVTKSGKNYNLITGMSLTAEIVVEQVTMIDSILKPFRALKKG